MDSFKEDNYEKALLELFEYQLGYDVECGYDIGRDYENPLYMPVFEESLRRINCDLPSVAIDEAIIELQDFDLGSLEFRNDIFTSYLQNGITVSYMDGDEECSAVVSLIDYDDIGNNDFRVINQWIITNNSEDEERRPDIVVFVNGLPLVVMELKSPSREEVDISDAYTQLKNQMNKIPKLFYYNAFCVMSNMAINKAGTLTASEDRFMEWKSTDGSYENTQSADFNTFFEGIFEKERFIDILKNFLLYSRDSQSYSKIVGSYHQYFAVRKAVESTLRAIKGDHKAGVFWHTQGSGKSLSMVFYVHLLEQILENPTFVIVTDRNDLDNQLFTQFMQCSEFLRQTPIQAEGKEDLKNLLNNRKANGIFFTTIQKFDEYNEPLTERDDVIVLSDEAHRSQYGLEIKVNPQTGKKIVGDARRLRDALPNATYIGFTGTPISSKDKSTREIFGDYIDIYDMTQSVEDKATVPIYYEDRAVNIKLDKKILDEIDEKYDKLSENALNYDIEKSKKQLSKMEVILGSKETINTLVDDIIKHYEENREYELTGKAMIVAYSRNIAMKIYERILEIKPEWNEKVNIVMTSSNKDPEEWHDIIGTKAHKVELSRKFKDDNDPFKIAIVVDMWLTGFDVPSLATMYMYKHMEEHTLMQAITRVNRVYRDKEGGLIVDYIGLANSLKRAMSNYTLNDQKNYGDQNIENTAYPEFQKQLEICEDLFYGHDFTSFYEESDLKRANAIKEGVNFIESKNSEEAEDEYLKESLKLKQALSLCRSKTTEDERMDAAYFIAVRSLLSQITKKGQISLKEINNQINQLLKHSIKSEGILNLFEANQEEISLFDSTFLETIATMPEVNLARKMLEKIINDQIKIYRKTNIVKSEQFSKLLSDTLTKYTNGHISSEDVIKELIKMGENIKQAQDNGKKLGLTTEEQAFYDAITKPERIKDFYKNEELITMTQELTRKLNESKTIDWRKKKSARAKMKTIVIRLLRKYDYPPNEEKDAIETVLQQCELIADNI